MNGGSATNNARTLQGAILIAGPTASGKSALALRLANELGGIVVNADSMQVYSVLSVLTARPTPEEMAAIPHRLFGHVSPAAPYSTGAWVRDVQSLVAQGELLGRVPIFVGGTGLYFKALIEGLAAIPEVASDVRQHWRARLRQEGSRALHALLERDDPESGAKLDPADGQRIVRALEILDSSGRTMGEWQRQPAAPLIQAASARRIVVEPDRKTLHDRIERRFDTMIERGALDEVRSLQALALDSSMPAMKAIGVGELLAFLSGQVTQAEATTRAKAATRQYAKRQSTWFRHQLGPDWERFGGDLPRRAG